MGIAPFGSTIHHSFLHNGFLARISRSNARRPRFYVSLLTIYGDHLGVQNVKPLGRILPGRKYYEWRIRCAQSNQRLTYGTGFDKASGRVFWTNETTKKVQWTNPVTGFDKSGRAI